LENGCKMKKPDLCLILLCDNVKKVNDKFTYEGDINTINSRSFPVEHRAFFIVTKWINGEGVGFKQTLRIISEENGQEIFNSTPSEVEFNLVDKFQEHNVIGEIVGLVIPKEGFYRVEILLNNELVGFRYLKGAVQTAQK